MSAYLGVELHTLKHVVLQIQSSHSCTPRWQHPWTSQRPSPWRPPTTSCQQRARRKRCRCTPLPGRVDAAAATRCDPCPDGASAAPAPAPGAAVGVSTSRIPILLPTTPNAALGFEAKTRSTGAVRFEF